MKLLIITQKVNRNDPILGFFHGWIIEFAKHFESITAICLEKGEYNLPTNVKVLSLGKESGISRSKYLFNFYKYIWQERHNYDAVFVHMNQEYILLGGILWQLLGKKTYMWRNHHAGSFLTDIAAKFCKKVFCTSKFSFTAKYKKTVLMPVGINTDLFKIDQSIERVPKSILFLGRMAPIKRPHILIDALMEIDKKGMEYIASFVGDALPIDNDYYLSLKQKIKANNLENKIRLFKGIPNQKTPYIYNLHSVFVNLSTSGMYDKTIFEAMACGSLVLVSNKNLKGIIPDRYLFEEGNLVDLKKRLEEIINLDDDLKNNDRKIFSELVSKNSLSNLAQKIVIQIK
jgi:glycosyltransferase involved in cell wall biosynthesis